MTHGGPAMPFAAKVGSAARNGMATPVIILCVTNGISGKTHPRRWCTEGVST
ncbi:hypothetical protein BH23CHL4_BH23CHL4_06360 [soil metagenome]